MNAVDPSLEASLIADWRTYPIVADLVDVKPREQALDTLWRDGRISLFHHQWLRDNCACNQCVYGVTREQLFEIVDVPEELHPQRTRIDEQGHLLIDWQDGHRSRYHPGWLRAHAYDEASRAERRAQRPQSRLWGAELGEQLPQFDYQAVMEQDDALLHWLLAVRDIGLTQLRDVPTREDVLPRLAKRISFIRESNFGVLFDVQSKADADSNAYTAFNLPLHTDLPTRELQPGLQFLHCLVNEATGGESVFVDGFAIAEALHQETPELFHLLCETPVEFRNKSRNSDYRCLAPIIALDAHGAVSEIRMGNFLRGPFDAPAERMPAFYSAYRRFIGMTREPRFRVQRRLEAGQLWCFDNRRTLHARTEFDPASGARHFKGCYVDRDELLSRIHVLQR
ncbi:gamma-butyrobetaine dioxygenase [Pseudomonas benzenivorans]|uniref:Gamma-butyrobetaine dioxygenase n=1 Tax=Pseudomonas benzenivorans TaxID=556533 RepID=A0ABZ0PWC2_9PSED|nr:gamma-butyrobetaine dioxygenase [Pseudomonas benzenivorans]WPC04805.1 gamma-butyrobetaine dioxygenase [Pseudomonas benzenivorans]